MAKALVIGGSGFLGSHLVPKLLEANYEVTVQDVVPPDQATRIKDLLPRLQYQWKSLLDLNPDDVSSCDYVVALAAQADVPLSITSPRWTFTQNLDGTMALLEALRSIREHQGKEARLKKMLYMSSEQVYGHVPPENLPITEQFPYRPANAYAASKAAAELFCKTYAAQWSIPVIIFRSTTMYGERSRLKQAIPTFIKQALAGAPVTIEGTGSQTRDFNYVGNMASAIVKGLESRFTSGEWNIGSGKETSIRELADEIIKATGSKSQVVQKPWRQGEEGARFSISIEKAKTDLGYVPSVSLVEGLKRSIDWIKSLR